MKLLLLALLSLLPAFSQTSVFMEAGAESGRNISGGIGIAQTIAANTQAFVELTETTGASASQQSDILLGIKTNLPTVKKVTPFTIVGYGGAISSLSKLTSLPSTVTGLNTTSITAIGTAVGLAQKYAAGFEYPVGGFNIGIGATVDKNSTVAWKAYPFLFLSKTF